MKRWKWPACTMVLLSALLVVSGCSDDDDAGPLELQLGNMREQSISPNGTNLYFFITTSSSVYRISWDQVSSGDAENLDLSASDAPFTCAVNLSFNMDCDSNNTLAAGQIYNFSLTEVAGQSATFRVGVAIPSP